MYSRTYRRARSRRRRLRTRRAPRPRRSTRSGAAGEGRTRPGARVRPCSRRACAPTSCLPLFVRERFADSSQGAQFTEHCVLTYSLLTHLLRTYLSFTTTTQPQGRVGDAAAVGRRLRGHDGEPQPDRRRRRGQPLAALPLDRRLLDVPLAGG